MPTGPKGQKRPADVASNAVRIMQIATGQADDVPVKNFAAVELGRLGGKARAKTLSKSKKKRIAKAAAESRWGRNRKKP